MKIKVRGIYSTALTNFLIEEGFEIVSPSKVINERFDLKGTPNEIADTQIFDKEDLNGITVNGIFAESVVKAIQKEFLDVTVKKIEKGDIYLGRIKSINNSTKTLLIDLSENLTGILSIQYFWGVIKEGEKILVQVKGAMGNKKILSTQLRLFGENCILIKDGFTKVSKHIANPEEMERLKEIATKMNIQGWGILWKSLAEGKNDEELIAEVKSLAEEEKELRDLIKGKEEVGIIKQGGHNYFIDFGAVSKRNLDRIRSKVTTTIVGHHFLKSGGYHLVTDFAESLSGMDDNVLISKLNSTLWKDGLQEGQSYQIIHKKPGSRDILFRGTVHKANDKEIIIRRNLVPGGEYDGIGGRIESGDYALSIIKPNEWTVIHKYFDKNGLGKGVYINVNTPVEVYPKFSRYIDLEVDVIEKNNEKLIIDKDKLEKIKNEGTISEALAAKALEIANNVLTEESK